MDISIFECDFQTTFLET